MYFIVHVELKEADLEQNQSDRILIICGAFLESRTLQPCPCTHISVIITSSYPLNNMEP